MDRRALRAAGDRLEPVLPRPGDRRHPGRRGSGSAVAIEPDLRERSYGAFAGQPYETPRPGYDPAAYWTWQPPGGESLRGGPGPGRGGARPDRDGPRG